jgi:hypothetical protein
MNRPDKAGEPSMEEILASIRQIIADEPAADTPEPAIESNPLVPSHGPKPAEHRVPLADRLSDVLKNGSLPPTSPLGSKRPLSFDQDLADMFDDDAPANGSSVSAPKPDMRLPTALSHPMSTRPFVSPVQQPIDDAKTATEETKESAKAEVVDDGAAALPQQPAPSEALAPPPPFGSAEKPAEVAPPTTFGFPPLRKASFYPPQPKAPVAPKPASADFVPSRPVSPAPEATVAASPHASVSVPAGDAVAPNGFGSTASGEASSSFAADPMGAPSQPYAADAPALQDAPRYRETPFASFAPPSASAPAAPASPILGASVEPQVGSSPMTSRAGASSTIEPRAYADPFAQTVRPSPGHMAQLGAEPGLSSDAAHQALDALAQGLAASAAASSIPTGEPVSPAIPLTPVFETVEPDPRTQFGPSTLPATIPSQGSVPVNRTLEDAVADMLRPMLQQWVAENMPRIIERALRTEVAQTVKPGNKPPGT